MTKTVTCRILGEGKWENPEMIVLFETEEGFRFTCKAKEVPWRVHVDSSQKLKAQVEAESDDHGYVQLIKFIRD